MLLATFALATSALLGASALNDPTLTPTCDTKDFGGHHCHLELTNLSSPSVTSQSACSAAVCAAGGGLDTSQWCAEGAGCSPSGCYGATVSKQASCPRTHGWETSLINYNPPPPPPPGMQSRTVPQATADRHGAKCLNGAAPTVEIRLNASSTKWILFLEGGGWCYGSSANDTIKSCAGRGGFVPSSEEPSTLGSAAHPVADYGGVMGSSPDTNPDFYS